LRLSAPAGGRILGSGPSCVRYADTRGPRSPVGRLHARRAACRRTQRQRDCATAARRDAPPHVPKRLLDRPARVTAAGGAVVRSGACLRRRRGAESLQRRGFVEVARGAVGLRRRDDAAPRQEGHRGDQAASHAAARRRRRGRSTRNPGDIGGADAAGPRGRRATASAEARRPSGGGPAIAGGITEGEGARASRSSLPRCPVPAAGGDLDDPERARVALPSAVPAVRHSAT
jgi:hypothetical protein